MAQMAVTFALNRLTSKLEKGLDRKTGEEVMRIMADIEDMAEFLNDADTRRDKESNIELWVSHARRLAYQVEDLLDIHTFHNRLLVIIMTTLQLCIAIPLAFLHLKFPWSIAVITLPLFIRMVSMVEPVVRSRRFLRELRGIREELAYVREKMKQFSFKTTVDTESPGVLETRDLSPFVSPSATMVGRDKEMQEMEEWLCDIGPSTTQNCNVKVIFVVGMVGTGKTTLAKNAYDKLKLHFDSFAFAFVSRPFQPEALLRGMLKSLYDSRSETPPSGVDEMLKDALQKKMAAYLQGKEYMLVVDDVGEQSVWEIVKDALPRRPPPTDQSKALISNGKVVFTTRDMGLPDKIVGGEDNRVGVVRVHSLKLEPLSPEDASTLFRKRALPNIQTEELPDQLKDIGEEILRKCDGIPLAINTVGALLSTKKGTQQEWKKVLDKLDYMMTGDSFDGHVFVSSGYADLPPVLKRCFLYCSLFPENYEIPRKKLIRMWVAEDFATSTSISTTAEEAAESQLMQLIDRNMLQVARTGLKGEVMSCRVLWLMRKFARALSTKDEFCTVLPSGGSGGGGNRDGGYGGSGGSGNDIGGDQEGEEEEEEKEEKAPIWESIRRLAVHSNAENLINSEMGTSKILRTLLFFQMIEQQHNFFKISKLPRKLMLLRVLELQGLRIKTLPPAVGNLVLLRYLGLRGTAIRWLPKRLLKLTQLQTLDIRDTEVRELPDLYMLKELRHLLLQGSFSDKVIGVKRGIMWATDLETLSGLKLKRHLAQELGTLNNIRKLSIGKVRKDDSNKLCVSINRMKRLQSLTLKCDMFDSFDTNRLAPLNPLKKLKLGGQVHGPLDWITKTTFLTHLYMWNSGLAEDPLATLQVLSNLVLLSLYDVYNGNEIRCDAEGFPKLKKLSILQFTNLKIWGKIENAMPELQKLFIGYCPKLVDPPEGLINLKSLEIVQVARMSAGFEERLRENTHEHGYKVQHIPQLADTTTLSRKLFPSLPKINVGASTSRYEDQDPDILQRASTSNANQTDGSTQASTSRAFHPSEDDVSS